MFSEVGADATGITFGPDGDLYVGKRQTGEVVRFDGVTGQFLDVFVEAGVIDATSDLLFGPAGDLYVSSRSNSTASKDGVFRFSGATGDLVSTITTRAEGLGLTHPNGLAFGPDGNLYVAGFSSGNVQRFNPSTGVYIDDFVQVDRATRLLFIPPSVPEPNTLALIIAGLVIVARGRRDLR